MTLQSTTLTRRQTPTTSPLSSGLLQRKCSCGQQTIAIGECSECQKKRSLLRHRSINQAESSEVPPIVHEVLRSQGQPLDTNTQAFMGDRFGYHFDHVRIHVGSLGSKAAKSAQAVNALAYTVGHNIVFAAGQYAPTTPSGHKLLAHELTHVIQQGNLTESQSSLRYDNPSSTAEREAEHYSEKIATQSAVNTVQTLSFPLLQRQTATRPPTAEAEEDSPSAEDNNEERPRQPNFDSTCSNFHRCKLEDALVNSQQMVGSVLTELPQITRGRVTTGRIIDLLNVHFHTASAQNAAKILDNFRRIRSELNAPIRYICHSDVPSDCEGFVGGFTNCAPGKDIHLCAPYFVSFNCEQQARALVHEAAHHIPGFLCRGETYLGQPAYMTLPPDWSLD